MGTKKLGDPVDKNLYGIPSPYEHNNIRRTHNLLSSGDAYASISLCPIHESEGIITPNGLFFTRNHGGTAHIDPNEFRLMIHGKVKREIVLTLEDLKDTQVKLELILLNVLQMEAQNGEVHNLIVYNL